MQAATAGEPEMLPVFAGASLEHAFASELPELGVPWRAAPAPNPSISVLNTALAAELGLDTKTLEGPRGAEWLVGRALAEGSDPVAQIYAGHQFGSYSARLGDGRALLLGEIRSPEGRLVDLHLKGSGRTPLARADGFAALGPMLREHLVSEAMQALGVPTTRSLAVLQTGRTVLRDDFVHGGAVPGAVLARVAASHVRVGTFQYARSTGDRALLERLVDFAIRRHYPYLEGEERSALGLFREVVRAQGSLVAEWMLVGFVHGVLNTDNVTVSGETIDYGPCAFIDAYDPAAVFSSIDHGGRYAFGAQAPIMRWNLARFAESLLPLLVDAVGQQEDEDRALSLAIDLAQAELAEFDRHFTRACAEGMAAKLGLGGVDNEEVRQLSSELFGLLADGRVDYTLAFRRLTDAAAEAREGDLWGGEVQPGGEGRAGSEAQAGGEDRSAGERISTAREMLAGAGDTGHDRADRVQAWFGRWLAHDPDAAPMLAANPVTIPRNHLLAEALDAATGGDLAPFEQMLEAVSSPYEQRAEWAHYALPAQPGAGRFVSTCGT